MHASAADVKPNRSSRRRRRGRCPRRPKCARPAIDMAGHPRRRRRHARSDRNAVGQRRRRRRRQRTCSTCWRPRSPPAIRRPASWSASARSRAARSRCRTSAGWPTKRRLPLERDNLRLLYGRWLVQESLVRRGSRATRRAQARATSSIRRRCCFIRPSCSTARSIATPG